MFCPSGCSWCRVWCCWPRSGFLEAFRLVLVKPIFDRVLNPSTGSDNIQLFTIPGSGHVVYLQQFVPAHFHNAWTIVAYALVASTILKGIFDYAGTYLVNHAGFGMITDLRNDLYNSVLRRSAAFFQKHTTGTLISTIINDIERVQYAMSSVLAEFLQQFFTFLFTAVAVIVLGRKLAWVLLLFIPFIIYSAVRIGRRVRSTTRGGQDKLADIQNILQETISGNRIVKAFSMESWEMARFRQAAQRLFQGQPALGGGGGDEFSPDGYFRGDCDRHAFVTGPRPDRAQRIYRWERLAHSSPPYSACITRCGSLPCLTTISSRRWARPRRFSSSWIPRTTSRKSPGSSRCRLLPIAYGWRVCASPTRRTATSRGKFCATSIWKCGRGEVVAVVGSSGAGKSTLVHLIPRFFDVTAGRLLIDGRDVRDTTLASLRSQIGVVTQETVLFNDTLRNNIAYGQPSISQKQVEAAARAALAHDFIMELPNGYETMIGERGVRLSGGERQRIAIARALLKNAPILILDEATSALDSESEALVQSALQNLMTGRTVFVIAHRLSTVRRADRIVVLENGTIEDIGAHEELMQKPGTYRRLYDLQFAEGEQPKVNAIR